MKINNLKIDYNEDRDDYDGSIYCQYNPRKTFTIDGFKDGKIIHLEIIDYDNNLELNSNSEIEIVIKNKVETTTRL